MSTDVQCTNEPGDPGDQRAGSSATGSGASCPAGDGTGMGIPPRSPSDRSKPVMRVPALLMPCDGHPLRRWYRFEAIEPDVVEFRWDVVRRGVFGSYARHEVIPVPDCNWSWSWLR